MIHRRNALPALLLVGCLITPALAKSITATVKDGWGKQVTVQGYDDAKLDDEWTVHDPRRPQPKAIEPDESPTLGSEAPEGALILFDGANLDAWHGGAWKLLPDDRAMMVGKGSLKTKKPFRNVRLHIEWQTPIDDKGKAQARGNSGIFFMGRYEVQVLDSWKNATYPDGMAGAIYGQKPPRVNAARPPGEWQTYDITFMAPEFDDDGKVVKPATMTVLWNGVPVQDKFELIGKTTHRRKAEYKAHDDAGPIMLQDHGDKVQFRNIWVVELDDTGRVKDCGC